ncbi:hypothetical protein K9B32_16445 [Rhizobium sp. 3T7]|uniref:hypothetical protein n=1 Tax=Rhizobium sp. 3T7 TaxID=2874922 RepID=UPI001CCA18B3|nr:hypothetical protein [Rhizobium sp. 3T7]MBZ9791696.1 hypothetical protein [Rhizobium sp. 3T7]
MIKRSLLRLLLFPAAAVVVALVATYGARSAELITKTPYDARKIIIDKGMWNVDGELKKLGCGSASREDESSCRLYLAMSAIYHYHHGDFEKVRILLETYKQSSARLNDRDTCPRISFSLVGYAINFSYDTTLFQTESKGDRDLALKAYLCESWYSNNFSRVGPYTNIGPKKLSRAAFISTVRSAYGSSPSYDVQRYLDEILAPLREKEIALRKGKEWGQNPDVDREDRRALAGLEREARKACLQARLDGKFCDFLGQQAEFHSPSTHD